MTPSGACWSRMLQRGRVQSLLLFLSLFFTPARSGLVNVTVDDTSGDPTTGTIPQYSAGSDDAWNAGSPSESCSSCHINPSNLDLNQIHGQTWHDTTILPSGTASASISVQFTGSAVYVFNILPNTLQGTITSADISFSIDGADPDVFTRSPDSSATILYNQLVYSNTALDYGPHTLVMTPNSNSLILFDYLVYTAQDDDSPQPPASPSSTSASRSSSDSEASSQPLSSSPPGTSTSTPSDGLQSSSSSSSTFLSTSTPQGSSQSLSLSHNTSSLTGSSGTSSSSSARFLNGSSRSTSTSASSSAPASTRTGSPADGSSQSRSSHTPLGAIVGGAALGGIALLVVVALGVRCLRRAWRGRSVAPFLRAARVAVRAANGGHGRTDRDRDRDRDARGHGDGEGSLGDSDDNDSHRDGDGSSSFAAPSMPVVSTAPLISSEPRWLAERRDRDRVGGRALPDLDAFDVRVRVVPRPDSDVMPRLGAAALTIRGPASPSELSSPSPSPSTWTWTDPGDSSEKRRAELARRLETLQSTRSALSSPDPNAVSVSRSESVANSTSGRRGDPETAIRDLEAEIAHLRAALTAMNARRLADSDSDSDAYRGAGDSRSELLPAYAE